MLFDPGSVGLTASCTRLELLVSVTCKPAPGAAAVRITVAAPSRNWPTVNWLFIEKLALETVACTEPEVYPAALAVMVDVPAPTGWNVVAPKEEPPLIATGEVVMVPTLVVPLVTIALTDLSAATASRIGPLSGSAAVYTFSVASVPAPSVVVKFVPNPNGVWMTKPDGASGIVAGTVP
jgi:hypothetical protein